MSSNDVVVFVVYFQGRYLTI